MNTANLATPAPQHLPQLSARKRVLLKLLTPMSLASPARLMLQPTRRLAREFAIPHEALVQAFGAGSEHRRRLERAAEPVRALAQEHGFFWPAAWQRLGLIARVSGAHVV